MFDEDAKIDVYSQFFQHQHFVNKFTFNFELPPWKVHLGNFQRPKSASFDLKYLFVQLTFYWSDGGGIKLSGKLMNKLLYFTWNHLIYL